MIYSHSAVSSMTFLDYMTDWMTDQLIDYNLIESFFFAWVIFFSGGVEWGGGGMGGVAKSTYCTGLILFWISCIIVDLISLKIVFYAVKVHVLNMLSLLFYLYINPVIYAFQSCTRSLNAQICPLSFLYDKCTLKFSGKNT